MDGLIQWILEKFIKSSKFWLSIAGMVAVFLQDKLGLDQTQVLEILTLIIALVLGKAHASKGWNMNPNNKVKK